MRVPEIKRCERCYKAISWESTSDYFSHIRIQYCEECKEIVAKEKTAARMKRLRERKKALDKEKDMRLKQLEAENDILRKRLEVLWDLKCRDENVGLCQDVTV